MAVQLMGTTDSVEQAASVIADREVDLDELTIEELRELDALVFLCSECGWWCGMSECSIVDDDQVCRECHGGD